MKIYIFFQVIQKQYLSMLLDSIDANNADIVENWIKYGEVCKQYKTFIKKYVAKCVKEAAIPNNSISRAFLLSMIMNAGFCSKDLKLDNNKDEFIDLNGLQGLSIIKGSACCRHYSSFFRDVFYELDMWTGYSICVVLNGESKDITFEEAMTYRATLHALNIIKYIMHLIL